MGLKNDYEPRSLEQLGEEAVEILRKWPGLGCGHIGDQLFRDHVGRLHGSAPYARLTGRVMRRLEKQGRACLRAKDGRWGWYLT